MTSEDAIQLEAMEAYFREGEARALALGNRGAVRYAARGELHPDILEAYDRCGFYVFENIIAPAELQELQQAYFDMVERLPTDPESLVDRAGRPALGTEQKGHAVSWVKPLSDPYGAANAAKARHQTKTQMQDNGTEGSFSERQAVGMYEFTPPAHLPDKVPTSIFAPLQYSDAMLRLYAHPDLLRISAGVNGDDFVPSNEALVFKRAGEGASVGWHQDGMTHWNSPDWHLRSHGFNFMVQLFGSTPANGVWYVLGSHRKGKTDIKAMIEQAGTQLLPGAVPLVCNAGDVVIHNRQTIHCSWPNVNADTRITVNIAFMPRRSVFGFSGRPYLTDHDIAYDEEAIRARARMIGYAIDARRRHFPGETPFAYRPHVEAGETYCWDETSKQASYGYHLKDLII